MSAVKKLPLGRRQIGQQFAITLVVNTLIAGLLTATGGDLLVNLVFSQCIGLSILSLSLLGIQSGLYTTGPRKVAVTVVAIVVGALFGSYLGLTLLGWDTRGIFGLRWQRYLTPVALGLFFGTVMTYFFYSRDRLHRLADLAKEEQIARLARERELAEAQLKLVQAQIEPHFLFNTLANISSLIERDSGKARQMLDDLNRYLRTVLDRTREGNTTLGEEVALLQSYLSILGVRMGERLRYRLDVPAALQDLAFPPLLIQPLVENAIRHGLEPKREGGAVTVGVRRGAEGLRVTVEDSGIGLVEGWHPGLGLDNVYRRLKGLYGDAAELRVENRPGGGVCAWFNLPIVGVVEGRS